MPPVGAWFDPAVRNSKSVLTIWVLAGLVMAVLVLAASSGPVRLWIKPPAGIDDSTVNTGSVESVEPLAPDDGEDSGPSWDGGVLNTVAGVLIVVLMVGGGALSVRALWPGVFVNGLGRRERTDQATGIAKAPEKSLSLDIEGAAAALSSGPPRNAIVACWMQLERDTAAVELPRLGAETSSEYAKRVVAESSVRSAPIAELAALYREARFSRHELSDVHRLRAAIALEGVAAALKHREKVLR